MSETKTNDEVIAENPIEKSGEVKTETKADYKVD